MRLDELPKSARIEDRRGVTVARGGIGVGTIVVLGLIGWALGIDPRLLIGGAEMMSRSGGPQQQADAGSTTSTGSPSETMGQFVSAGLGSKGAGGDRVLRGSWTNVETAAAGYVLGRNAVRMWVCEGRDGPVLLPDRSKGLSRYEFLSGSPTALWRLRCWQQDLPVLTSLRHCPRD